MGVLFSVPKRMEFTNFADKTVGMEHERSTGDFADSGEGSQALPSVGRSYPPRQTERLSTEPNSRETASVAAGLDRPFGMT